VLFEDVAIIAADEALVVELAVALLDMLMDDALLDVLMDDALLDVLMDTLVDELCWLSCTAVGEVIIVDIVIAGIMPEVTVIVTVHGAVDTTF
jgi:hypothetical protein